MLELVARRRNLMSEGLTGKLSASDGATLGEILTAVKNLDTRVGSINTRLGSLAQKVEDRLYDTRPIWESVQASIVQFLEEQQHLQEGQEFLRRESHEARTLLRDIFRRLSIFNDTLAPCKLTIETLRSRS
jgi:hypothetical protein